MVNERIGSIFIATTHPNDYKTNIYFGEASGSCLHGHMVLETAMITYLRDASGSVIINKDYS